MMKIEIKNNLLSILLIAFAIGGFCLWFFGENEIKDFGLNFFTEILGVVITVLIIDKLVKDRENKRMAPLKLAEYEDAFDLFSDFISFWTDAYSVSVNEEFPVTFDDFLSEKGFGKTFDNLDLNSKPNVTPERTWWSWILQNHKKWEEKSNKYLERHSAYSNPELYKLIHGFVEGTFMKVLPLMSSIKQSDQQQNFPRLQLLNQYAIEPRPEDYEILKKMNNQLELIEKELSKDFSNLKKFTFRPIELSKRKISCSLSQASLMDYIAKKKAYDEK